MFEKLLIPLDGSPLAEQALSAIDLFRRAGVHHVVLTRVLENDESEALGYLADVATRLGQAGVEVATSHAQGEPAEAIVAEVARHQADVLAMATHGRSGIGRMVYGSVTEAVLERTPVPVLLTRAWEGPLAPHLTDATERVLVPLDGSVLAEAVLPLAAALATSALAAQLTLLRVIEPPHQRVTGWVPGVVYSDLGTETEQTEALHYLQGAAERLQREHGVAASAIDVDVRVGRSVESILEASAAHECDLVCMATHAQSGLGRVIVGTVTDGVLRRGDNPLLLVRPS